MQKLAGECTEEAVSIVIYLSILGIIMRNLVQFEHKHLISLTSGKSAEKNYLKYDCFESRCIGLRCQKVPQLKMIKISIQMRVCELGIQIRRCRGHHGCVVREAILPINMDINNLIIVLMSVKCNIESKLYLGTANVQSIKNKDQLLSDFLLDYHLDVLVLTETWLKDTPTDKAWMDCSLITQGTYKCLTSNTAGSRKGGGLALSYKLEIKCKDVHLMIKNSFECSGWKLDFNSNNLLVIGIYHSPNTKNGSNQVFINEFLKMLEEVQSGNLQLIIIGNFNLHVNNKEDNDVQQFLDMLEASDLHQSIAFMTPKHGNILDLVIIERASEVKMSNLKRGPFFQISVVFW